MRLVVAFLVFLLLVALSSAGAQKGRRVGRHSILLERDTSDLRFLDRQASNGADAASKLSHAMINERGIINRPSEQTIEREEGPKGGIDARPSVWYGDTEKKKSNRNPLSHRHRRSKTFLCLHSPSLSIANSLFFLFVVYCIGQLEDLELLWTNRLPRKMLAKFCLPSLHAQRLSHALTMLSKPPIHSTVKHPIRLGLNAKIDSSKEPSLRMMSLPRLHPSQCPPLPGPPPSILLPLVAAHLALASLLPLEGTPRSRYRWNTGPFLA